jgi:hypothetical protein
MHYQRWRLHGDPGPAAAQRSPAPPDGRCTLPNCDQPHAARGWCHRHYVRWLVHGDPTTADRERSTAPSDGLCTLPDCEQPHSAKGLCAAHYRRARRRADRAAAGD